jgi:S-adenosylmethionine/arginine decarboxylase-like enzyme
MAKYGPHLTLDLVGCNPAKTTDAKFICNFFKEIPGLIGMNKIGEPHMDLYNGIHPDWDGWSVTVHIQESHITGHFFEWGCMFLDIFSCKDFDHEGAAKMIMETFEADQHAPLFKEETPETIAATKYLVDQKSIWRYAERGLNFPPSLK